jgi:outer membrane receptor protein involved in Fe transport
LTWGDASFRRFAVKGFGQTHIHGRDRSAESILEWNPDASLKAVGGVSWLAMDLDQFIDLTVTPLGTGTFKDWQRSLGLFGEVTWHPAPRVMLIGGMRYQRDSKRRLGVLHTTPDLPLDYDKTSDAFLPKVSAAYDLSPDLRAGVLVQRAYNPGGVTLDPAIAGEVQFKPEYLWDYEAFVRGRSLGGALSVTGNLFYYDMRDAQRTLDLCLDTPTGCVGLSEVSNAPRAHTYGAELELDYRPSGRLRLRSGIGLLGTRITRTILPTDPILNKQFGGSPKFTGMAALDWEALRGVNLSAQVHHYSSYFQDDAETRETRIQPATIVDARASWQTGRFTLFAYAQNLLDQFRVTVWFDPPGTPNGEVGTNDPREIGVGIEARF